LAIDHDRRQHSDRTRLHLRRRNCLRGIDHTIDVRGESFERYANRFRVDKATGKKRFAVKQMKVNLPPSVWSSARHGMVLLAAAASGPDHRRGEFPALRTLPKFRPF
jgi:hypothetical protein